MKQIIKKIIPYRLLAYINRCKELNKYHKWNVFWEKKCLEVNNASNNRNALEYNIVSTSHVVEKGIAMPNRRYGFGVEKVRQLIRFLQNYEKNYNTSETFSFLTALNTLKTYKKIHQDANYELPKDIDCAISALLEKYAKYDIKSIETFSTKTSFFSRCNNFTEFAKQRKTVRNFSNEEVKLNEICEAIAISQTAPSACNRQSTKVKVVCSKEKKEKLLSLQNGNRGFGYLANKIILVTTDLYAWEKEYRTSAFLDAGIFIMNMLYALHEKHICACTLNAHFDEEGLNMIWKEYCPDNEIPVALILLGKPHEDFQIATSERCDTKDIITIL